MPLEINQKENANIIAQNFPHELYVLHLPRGFSEVTSGDIAILICEIVIKKIIKTKQLIISNGAVITFSFLIDTGINYLILYNS